MKSNIKKIFMFFLTTVVLFTLGACGSNPDKAVTEKKDESTTEKIDIQVVDDDGEGETEAW